MINKKCINTRIIIPTKQEHNCNANIEVTEVSKLEMSSKFDRGFNYNDSYQGYDYVVKPEIDLDSINNNDYEFVIADSENVIKIDNDKILANTYIGEREQIEAIKKANENIKEEISKNSDIFDMAENRLKKMIKAYIDTVNIMFHKKYTINWI